MAKTARRTPEAEPAAWAAVRKLALALPDVAEAPCYGTPGFRVAGNLFARLHEDRVSLVLRMDPAERAIRLRADPKAFFITPHYADHPWMLVRLAAVSRADLKELLADAWRRRAPSRLLTEFETAAARQGGFQPLRRATHGAERRPPRKRRAE